MINHRLLKIFGCISLLILIVGCGTSPPARLYLLEPTVVDDSGVETLPISVVVDEVAIPEYLARKGIISQDKQYAINVASFDRWAGFLEGNITSVLAENISNLIESDKVVAYPWIIGGKVDFTVKVQIIAFGSEPSGNVVLKALWRIVDHANGGDILRKTHYTQSRTTTTPIATVEAMSQVLGELSHDISKILRTLTKPVDK